MEFNRVQCEVLYVDKQNMTHVLFRNLANILLLVQCSKEIHGTSMVVMSGHKHLHLCSAFTSVSVLTFKLNRKAQTPFVHSTIPLLCYSIVFGPEPCGHTFYLATPVVRDKLNR